MSDPAYPDALPAQYRLHWYGIERVLGQGGFGITYLARDSNLDQLVAIKEYLPVEVAARRADATVRPRTDDQAERYRGGLERFIREARTLARFDHPNIVRVHSVFEHNGTAYMVMRFEEGENFATLLERRRTIPEDELRRVLLPVLDGLELVHGAGFIHRDIKPDNIHIRADGSPVLLDFGSARHSLGHARTVTILVAPGYAPFEQYYSSGENQGPWTDIYGLGATCYRAITGVPPMDAIARSKGILGSTREILVPAATIGAGRYSAGFLKAVDHALEFAEKDRPQSIPQWREELAGKAAAPQPAAAGVVAAPAPTGGKAPVAWAILGAVVAAVAVIAWIRPGGDQQRIADLERRVDEQRQREERARQEAGEQERQRSDEAAKLRDELKQRELQLAAERKRAEDDARAAREIAQKPVESKRAPASKVAAKPAPVPSPAPAPAAAPVPVPAPPVATLKEEAPVPAPAPARKAAEALPPADEKDAVGFYRQRAREGDAEAMVRLGDFYADGRGVPQNVNQAYIWYGLAARAGSAAGKSRQAQAASKLQPAEVLQADRAIERQARPGK